MIKKMCTSEIKINRIIIIFQKFKSGKECLKQKMIILIKLGQFQKLSYDKLRLLTVINDSNFTDDVSNELFFYYQESLNKIFNV